MTDRIDWVEIIEPRTKKHMYANLITGECVWDQPVGQKVKKTDHNQWWELYDPNTSRFYYYNATSQQTVWQRPEKSDIIPLAKLQTLKQNTEVRDEESGKARKKDSTSTQTIEQNGIMSLAAMVGGINSNKKEGRTERFPQGSVRKLSSQTQTTPHSSPKDAKRHPNHHHHSHKCAHSHAVRPGNSQGNADQALRVVAPIQRQQSSGSQHRTVLVRDSSFRCENLPETINGGHYRLHPNNGAVIGSTIGRTPSPRSSALSAPHEKSSSNFSQNGCCDNHPLNENERSDDPIENGARLPTSSSFVRISPMMNVPRRQRSFDYKNGFFDNAEGSLPYRSRDLYHTPSMPSGIRSVESTPRIQRRNNNEAQLPQIDESNGHYPFTGRQQHDAFAISGGTPMQSRKRRSFPKPVVNPSPSPNLSRGHATTPSNSQPASGSSSQSYSSLESKRSLAGSNSSSTVMSSQNSIPLFANQHFVSGNVRQENLHSVSPNQWKSPHGLTAGSVTFMKAIQPQDVKVKRTISIDRADLKSPSSDGSSGKMSTFSPQLHRSATAKASSKATIGHIDRTEEDRKAEDLLREAKKFVPQNGTVAYPPPNNGRQHTKANTTEERRYVPSQEQVHSDMDTGSDNDADVEDSDEFDEESEEDDDDVGALDSAGNNRYGHLSPSQLRQHPNYCVVDRAMKTLCFDPVVTENVSSEEEETIVAQRERIHHPVDTRHASLRRNFGHVVPGPKLPGLEKSQSMQTELSAQQQPRPLSTVLPTQSEASLISSTKSSSPVGRPYYPGFNGSTTLTRERSCFENNSDTNRSGQVKLNDHTKGIFRKKVSIASLLSWSKDAIQKPLIMTTDKTAKKEACQMFRLVQMYMGDRKAKDNKSQDEIALDLTRYGWQKASLRDELFIQICKQTTDNRKPESLRRGWELLAICLAFFPPSANFFGYLHTYISRFQSPACDTSEVQVSHYASHCLKRLERMSQTGAKRGIRKPTVEEIQQARVQIFHPSMFGNTLEDVMQLQKERFPDQKLPWIQTTLSEEILRLNGSQTEGIFRVPGDIDEVNMLKVRMDRWNNPDCTDPHVPSSLLKLWYRELYEPLIPARFYDLCIQNCNNPTVAVHIVESLPEINRRVLTYLIRFLQQFAQAESITHVTKMDASNLAMVMAPNCLRCVSDDPTVIFENTRKEMAFLRTLVQHLDTEWIKEVR